MPRLLLAVLMLAGAITAAQAQTTIPADAGRAFRDANDGYELLADCSIYLPQPCRIDPAQYGQPRTRKGCLAAALARGLNGSGQITCVRVRVGHPEIIAETLKPKDMTHGR